jgi:phosphonate transport system ATP-binding protein
MESFARLAATERLTFVFTSHNLQHAIGYSERILALRDGAIALDGPSKRQNPVVLRELYDKPARPNPLVAAAN